MDALADVSMVEWAGRDFGDALQNRSGSASAICLVAKSARSALGGNPRHRRGWHFSRDRGCLPAVDGIRAGRKLQLGRPLSRTKRICERRTAQSHRLAKWTPDRGSREIFSVESSGYREAEFSNTTRLDGGPAMALRSQ